MTKILDLIKELCPDGVQNVALREVINYEQPTKYLVSSTDYQDTFNTPVLTAGQTFILGYTDEVEGIYPASELEPVIIFDDFTTAFKWVDFPFKAKSSAMKMLTSKDLDRASLRYLYFALQTIRYEPQEHARQWISNYSDFIVPLPPIEIQRLIVEMLDPFTQLLNQIEFELQARRRQLQNYRYELFSFDDRKDTRCIALGELCTEIIVPMRDRPKTFDGDIPWCRIEDIEGDTLNTSLSGLFVSNLVVSGMNLKVMPAGTVIASCSASIGRYAITTQPLVTNQTFIGLVCGPKLNNRYLLHFLHTKTAELVGVSNSGTIPYISRAKFEALEIPTPTIETQNEIVKVLDNFVNLESELESELFARRKQYEYYRDKLLTFKELAA